MRDALILSIASVALFPPLKQLGWLAGGITMLVVLTLIGFLLRKP
ncbi:hypothetical protein VSS37_03850 [Candidatus Thiothrix sp. Deng01]|uniref:Uncharacterized protein n=1 Tax=Candidatus Thiothrix phosphatis TaxID=3112415 RepID=A0ABU6CTI2_9GAMM|nr:hypothetical protein [Candidatus Thiothrix sp. Deng01]MEB4590105.1 hypothetical protein [Candidatus Thiothrix sp. Deng01]